MSIATEVVYQDGVTTVDASWLNLIQEHLAGYVNLAVTVDGDTVTVAAGADDDAVGVYMDGQMRYIETDLEFVVAGGSGTYEVYLIPGSGDLIDIDVTLSSPPGGDYRQIAEVDWDGATITELRVTDGRREAHAHTVLDGSGVLSHASDIDDLTSGDPHTQYTHKDGSRAFTGEIDGVDGGSTTLVTKGYADSLHAEGVPIGTVLAYGGATAPSGWLLCDGTSYAVATYPDLAALLADAYGGDGGTNFNVPDLRQAFPLVKASSGTGSAIGDTGGSIDHDHTLPSHTHSEPAHTHSITGHTHTNPDTASDGSHSHTQGTTGSDGGHSHTGGSHTHTDGSLTAADSGQASVGSVNGSSATPGLFSEDDLDTAASASHSHGAGSYQASGYSVSGSSASASASHNHPPAINSKAHTHGVGNLSGSTGAGGTGATGSVADHTHTNPTTGSDGAHSHTVGSTTSALTVTSSGGSATSGSAAAANTDTKNGPYQALNYIIKATT